MFSNEQDVIKFLLECKKNKVRVSHIDIKSGEITSIDAVVTEE